MLVPTTIAAFFLIPLLTPAAASSILPSLSPLDSLLQLTTPVIPAHPHRRQSSPSISFGGQAIPLACESTCASTVPILRACESKTDEQGCLAVCNDLEDYSVCINCVLLNDQGTGQKITKEVYGNSEKVLDLVIQACGQRGGQAPKTKLLPFNQIGTNATNHASTGAGERTTQLGATVAAVVAAGGAAMALFL